MPKTTYSGPLKTFFFHLSGGFVRPSVRLPLHKYTSTSLRWHFLDLQSNIKYKTVIELNELFFIFSNSSFLSKVNSIYFLVEETVIQNAFVSCLRAGVFDDSAVTTD